MFEFLIIKFRISDVLATLKKFKFNKLIPPFHLFCFTTLLLVTYVTSVVRLGLKFALVKAKLRQK